MWGTESCCGVLACLLVLRRLSKKSLQDLTRYSSTAFAMTSCDMSRVDFLPPSPQVPLEDESSGYSQEETQHDCERVRIAPSLVLPVLTYTSQLVADAIAHSISDKFAAAGCHLVSNLVSPQVVLQLPRRYRTYIVGVLGLKFRALPARCLTPRLRKQEQ